MDSRSSNPTRGKGQALCRFENRDLVANPPVATTLHREKRGDKWVVKTGTGEDAEVEASYPTLDALKDNYIDIPQPFIPETEFPRPVEHDDFTFMAFPDADNPNQNEPVVVDRGRETKLSELPTDTDTTTDVDRSASDAATEAGGDTDPSDSPDTTTAEPTDTQAASTPEQSPTNEALTTPDGTSPDPTENGDTTPTPEINILPHELADALPIDVATETVNAWATGPYYPDMDSEAWTHICLYLEDEYPEAADAVESPSDLSTIIGTGGAQSTQTQTTNTQQKPSDSTDENSLMF